MLVSRQWLAALAEEYSQRVNAASPEANRRAVDDALDLLKAPPWHLRLLICGVESAASLWCILYRLMRLGAVDPAQEIKAFSRIPVISAPLLRIYRSMLALSWFEQPENLAALGITGTMEQRQERFRERRQGMP